MAGGTSSKVVQVTNIAPQATKDQLQALFGLLGKIEEIRLYPSIRDVSVPVISRICYVRYSDSPSVAIAQHMTNTVFIDRALICIPVSSGSIPDEYRALEMAASGTLVPGFNNTQQAESKLPHEVVSKIEGQMPNQVIKTYDPKLTNENLPEYPALPVNFDEKKVEETRRTILILNAESEWRLDDLIDYFKRAGEVKYARFAETDGRQKLVMVEFLEQKSVIYALRMQGSYYRGTSLNLYHSTQPITKPEAKSNEAAQKEIEEAMSIVKECHNQISAVIDPAFGIIGTAKDKSVAHRNSRDRSRSHSRRSKSRKSSRRSRSRKRSTSRTRRKRSPSKRKSRSRSRSRSKRRKRSTSRRKKSRSRSKDRKHRRRERSRSKHKSRTSRHRSRSRDRRSKSRDRSHSKHRTEKKKKSHREKRDEKKFSHSRSRSKSPSQKSPPIEKSKSSKRRSVEKKMKRISEERIRDYDAEEKLMDDNGCEASSKSDNMDISDSP